MHTVQFALTLLKSQLGTSNVISYIYEGFVWDDDDLTCQVVSGLSVAVILILTGIVIGLFIGVGICICRRRK